MSLFVCPICKGALFQQEKSLVCKNGHVFDKAKQGYVHLLAPNKMHAKIPGDNQQMVQSRREFLQTGFYSIFSDRLNELVLEAVQNISSPKILDAGCGEGYYTARLAKYLQEHECFAEIAGFDISKFAVKAAAGFCKQAEFAVASAFDIPAADSFADCVINVFAPIVPQELKRVSKIGSALILAVPGERHLFGLKEILYDCPYENEHKETEYEGFKFVKRVSVSSVISIDSPKIIQDLFAMTPYYWKTSVEGSERLKCAKSLKTEIHFDFLVYQRIDEI